MTFTEPRFYELDNGWARLADPLRYALAIDGGKAKLEITVPEGFVTDFASVPRFLWPIIPPRGKWSKPATLHDYLYSKSGDCSRFLADALFREAMQDCGVNWFIRAIIYYAVRIFGAPNWRVR